MRQTEDLVRARSSRAAVLHAEALAASQAGVISFRQAVGLGMTPSAIERRLRSGDWDRIYEGVFRIHWTPQTWEQGVRAALLRFGSKAVVSHRAAGFLLGLDGVAQIVELTVAGHYRSHAGVIVHQVRELPPDLWDANGLPITSPTRTLIDLASVLREESLELALESALRVGLVSTQKVEQAVEKARRRRGIPKLRSILGERYGAAPTGSLFEVKFQRVLRAADLPAPVRQHLVIVGGRSFYLDFAFPDSQIGIECDGFGAHGGRRSFDSDRERRTLLTSAGWRLLHFTWGDLSRPKWVAESVRRAFKTVL